MADDAITAPSVLALPRGVTPGRVGLVVALAAATAAYLVTFPDGSDGLVHSDDGLNYARQIEQEGWRTLLHPHHLFYHWLGRVMARAARPFTAWSWHATLLGLKVLSALSGALAVGFVYLALRRCTGDRFAATLGASSLACFSGFWYFASVPESMAPPAAAMAGALWALAGDRGRSPVRSHAYAGLWHAAATLLRQDQILFVPALVAHAVVAAPRRWRRRVAAYLLAYGVPVGAAYLAVYWFVVRGVGKAPSLWHWLTSYGQMGIWGEGVQSLQVAWLSLKAVAWRYVLGSAIRPGHSLLLAGVLLLLFLAVPGGVRQGRRVWAFWALAAVWLAVAFPFYAWWDPGNAYAYMMGSLVPTACVLGLAAARARGVGDPIYWRYQRGLVACLVPAILWITWGGLVRPLQATTLRDEAGVWAATTTDDDLVLTNRYTLHIALKYTMGRDAVWVRGLPYALFGGMNAEAVAAMVDRFHAAGRQVYVTQDVFDGLWSTTDFARAADGFEQSYKVDPIHEEVLRALKAYRLEPVHLGDGPRGPVKAWRVLPRAGGR